RRRCMDHPSPRLTATDRKTLRRSPSEGASTYVRAREGHTASFCDRCLCLFVSHASAAARYLFAVELLDPRHVSCPQDTATPILTFSRSSSCGIFWSSGRLSVHWDRPCSAGTGVILVCSAAAVPLLLVRLGGSTAVTLISERSRFSWPFP